MEAIISLFISYILGSISFSYILAKRIAGIDIRQHGSKNAGATNTLRILGKGPAVFVLFLDALKGVAAVLIAMQISGEPIWIMVAGLLAIVGHNWPIFFGFMGGKGVATTIGVMFTLAFLPTFISGLIAILTIILFRYVSLGSLVFATLLPVFMYIFQTPMAYIYGAVIVMILSYFRHRSNVVRLLKGEENKLKSNV